MKDKDKLNVIISIINHAWDTSSVITEKDSAGFWIGIATAIEAAYLAEEDDDG